MNIKILDSWLRDYVKTDAKPHKIGELLSLTSVSVERIEKYHNDYLYDIEVTTNRPDLMSVIGIARETATVLSQNGIRATFEPLKSKQPAINKHAATIDIKNDPKLVNRVCAVIMDVKVEKSPKEMTERLESTDIRSLNNLIDITNYVMRVTGHPTHVFDFDRLNTKTLSIRESKAEEKIITLDKKEYKLPGGDIVAVNDQGEIVDLLGVMGLENSVVMHETKRILFFIDNVEQHHIRKTSMSLGIRTEAAVINEKGIDPELAMAALLYGISLYEKHANGKIISPIIDIYPNKTERKAVTVSEKKIQSVIGVNISVHQAAEILQKLGFETEITHDYKSPQGNENPAVTVIPPSIRAKDIQIPEDVIEEIARVYGYHNVPDTLPPIASAETLHLKDNMFYWEDKVKDTMKYWGFTEVYTYTMVSDDMYEGPLEDAIAIDNPLSEDFTYMRKTLVPSLLKVVKENKNRDVLSIFEIANVYTRKGHDLPEQHIKFAAVIKKPEVTFFDAKGILEQLFSELGIEHVFWKSLEKGGDGASILIEKTHAGNVEVLDNNLVNFELDFELLTQHATLTKKYKPVSKYPAVVEDMAIIAPGSVTTGDLIEVINKQDELIASVSLFDKYKDTRTFHIVYQSYKKNLTSEDVTPIREKILRVLREKFNAKLKEK